METQKKIIVMGVLSEGISLGIKNAVSLLVATVLWIVTIWIPYLNVGTTIAMTTIPIELSKGKVISPVFIFDSKYRKYMGEYFTLIGLMAMAVIPAPDLSQKTAILNYLVNTARAMGIDRPKVALIAATEQMLPKMPACVEAAIIAKMVDRGQIRNCIADGPLALDVAIDQEAVEIKHVVSPVAGDADCLVFPNIESANVFYKCNSKLAANVKQAGMVVGAKVPCVLSSRADSIDTKLNSIAIAAMSAK